MSRGLGLGWLPIAFASCFLSGLFISYGLAVYYGSINPVWPYISDTGVALPETCVFSLFFNISGFLSLSIMVIRYRYISNAVRETDSKIQRIASANMGIGCISVLGFLFVANFPEYISGPIHTVSAVIMFLTGLIYQYIDCHITIKLCPLWNTRVVSAMRIWIAAMAGIFLVMTFVSEIVAWVQWEHGEEPLGASWMIYQPNYPGYTAHLVSTISEWLMAGFFVSYFLTFIHEFCRFDLELRILLQPNTVTQPLRKTVPKATENTHLVAGKSVGGDWIPTTEQQYHANN